MPVTKDDVLAALGKVAAPDGAPLPKTGTLSDIVASDGKVFFSITVDAGVVQAWEPVRKRAEEAVKAMPGVQSAMVALTAERKGGAALRRAPAARRTGRGRPRRPHARPRPAAGAVRRAGRRPRSSRSLRARAASANRPPRSIWRSACAISA